MLKFLLLAFLITGGFALECRLHAAPWGGAWVPDAALLLLFLYALHGEGRFLFAFCVLLGWLRGVGLAEPAGFYILAYLFMGHVLAGTRTYFFIERIVTQLTLCLLMGMMYLVLQWVCRGLGFLPEPCDGGLAPLFLSCATASCLVPLLVPLYKRLHYLRKLLHP